MKSQSNRAAKFPIPWANQRQRPDMVMISMFTRSIQKKNDGKSFITTRFSASLIVPFLLFFYLFVFFFLVSLLIQVPNPRYTRLYQSAGFLHYFVIGSEREERKWKIHKKTRSIACGFVRNIFQSQFLLRSRDVDSSPLELNYQFEFHSVSFRGFFGCFFLVFILCPFESPTFTINWTRS